tara:strand:+ start:157 stop:1509 length:1353 start_codon:yes stop_codon:yes gene_type:complete
MGFAPDFETALADTTATAEQEAQAATQAGTAQAAQTADEEQAAQTAARQAALQAAQQASQQQQQAAAQQAQQAAAQQAAQQAAALQAAQQAAQQTQQTQQTQQPQQVQQTPVSTGTGLFDYYRNALNLVSTDGGLAELASGAENAFRTDGNPYASNAAGDLVTVSGPDGSPTASVPNYTYERAMVPGNYDPNRRPGSRGQRYFSDAAFVPQGDSQRQTIRNAYTNQANDAQMVNRANAAQQRQFESRPRPAYTPPANTAMGFGAYTPRANAPSGVATGTPAPTQNDLIAFLTQEQRAREKAAAEAAEAAGGTNPTTPVTPAGMTNPNQAVTNMRSGGIASLAGGGPASAYNRRYNGYAMGGMPQAQGYYLGGATDGMADTVPAKINGTQEARLSDGEFVVPADVVSHLGNGNSSAGAKNLYGMMDRVRTARTGNKQQGKQIDPNKFIPSG